MKNFGALAAVLFVVAVAAVVFFAFELSQGSSATGLLVAQKPLVVRAGYLPDVLISTPFIVALDQGLFEREGIKIELTKFASSKDMHDALLAGRLDITSLVGYPNLFAAETVSPGRAKALGFAADSDEKFMTFLLVRKDSEIRQVSELSSRKFGAPLGTNAKVWAKTVLNRWGAQNVEIVQMKYDLLLPALAAGQVDAIWGIEPLRAIGESKGITRVLVEHPRRVVLNPAPHVALLGVNADFIEKKPEAAARIVSAMRNAVDYTLTHEVEAKKLYAKHVGLDENVIANAKMPYLTLNASDEEIAQVQALANFLYSEGELKKPISAAPLYWRPN